MCLLLRQFYGHLIIMGIVHTVLNDARQARTSKSKLLLWLFVTRDRQIYKIWIFLKNIEEEAPHEKFFKSWKFFASGKKFARGQNSRGITAQNLLVKFYIAFWKFLKVLVEVRWLGFSLESSLIKPLTDEEVTQIGIEKS